MKFPSREQMVEIYHSAHPGALHIPGALGKKECCEIMEEILSLEGFIKCGKEGHVNQNMFTKYFEGDNFKDIETQMKSLLPHIKKYDAFYKSLQEDLGFSRARLNSVGIHHYPKSEEGISPHKDYIQSINLIGILTVSGKALFSIHTNDKQYDFPTEMGSFVLMRAHRNLKEKNLRPLHSVGKVDENRFAICLRDNDYSCKTS